MATIERIAEILKRGAATKVVAGVQVLARVIRVTHPRSLLALSYQDSDWRDTQSPPALTTPVLVISPPTGSAVSA